jgi:hypothetical protein
MADLPTARSLTAAELMRQLGFKFPAPVLELAASSRAPAPRYELRPVLEKRLLHITNGDSAAGTLRLSGISGEVAVTADLLHEGPAPGSLPPERWRKVRARYLAENGYDDYESALARLTRWDRALEDARSHDEVVLWFEHDLFDQLQLLQALSQVRPGTSVELIQTDDYLGAMDGDALESLWPDRRSLDQETLAAAREAWHGVTRGELEQDVPELPHLGAALRRFAEEPSRTKRQLLSALADGPRTPLQLFRANQEQEEAIFLGDTWCFLFLYELARDGEIRRAGGGQVPLPPPRGDYETFVSTVLELHD